jgi:hypothetical protein
MRRIGISLCLAALGVLLVGAAPVQPPRIVIPAKSATASGLRGAQTPNPAKPQPLAAPILAASQPASDVSAIPADPGQCRLSCAHGYYFCLSGQDAAFCPQSWTSCLGGCNRAPIQP